LPLLSFFGLVLSVLVAYAFFSNPPRAKAFPPSVHLVYLSFRTPSSRRQRSSPLLREAPNASGSSTNTFRAKPFSGLSAVLKRSTPCFSTHSLTFQRLSPLPEFSFLLSELTHHPLVARSRSHHRRAWSFFLLRQSHIRWIFLLF